MNSVKCLDWSDLAWALLGAIKFVTHSRLSENLKSLLSYGPLNVSKYPLKATCASRLTCINFHKFSGLKISPLLNWHPASSNLVSPSSSFLSSEWVQQGFQTSTIKALIEVNTFLFKNAPDSYVLPLHLIACEFFALKRANKGAVGAFALKLTLSTFALKLTLLTFALKSTLSIFGLKLTFYPHSISRDCVRMFASLSSPCQKLLSIHLCCQVECFQGGPSCHFCLGANKSTKPRTMKSRRAHVCEIWRDMYVDEIRETPANGHPLGI